MAHYNKNKRPYSLDDELEEQQRFEVEEINMGKDCVDSLPKNLKFTTFDIFQIIISISFYVGDIGSDIAVAVVFYKNCHYWWFALTILFVGLGTLAMSAFSYRWYLLDVEENNVPPVSHSTWALRIIFLILQLGPVFRYIDSIRYGKKYNKSKDSKEKREFYLKYYIYEEADATLLRLFECFLESAPQLVLQIYILTKTANAIPIESIGHLIPFEVQKAVQILSIIISLCSMSWTLASYQRALRHTQDEKQNLKWPGFFFQFIWRTFTIGSRVLALALFTSEYKNYIAFLFVLRWFLMTCWIISMNTEFYDNRCEETFYNAILGVMFFFCYFNPKDNPTRRRYLIYYVLTFIENTVLISLWYDKAPADLSYKLPALICQPMLFFLGLIFMIAYYLKFHPTGKIQVKTNWRKRRPPTEICDHDGRPCTELENKPSNASEL